MKTLKLLFVIVPFVGVLAALTHVFVTGTPNLLGVAIEMGVVSLGAACLYVTGEPKLMDRLTAAFAPVPCNCKGTPCSCPDID